MASATVLYTPEVLSLATSLVRWPWDDNLPLKGSARSRSCGSVVELGLETSPAGKITKVAIRAQACAIGQAAAAIFAEAAMGKTASEIASAHEAIANWLTGRGDLPVWPGLAAIAPALAYPGRHGAIMLGWQASRDLLPTG